MNDLLIPTIAISMQVIAMAYVLFKARGIK